MVKAAQARKQPTFFRHARCVTFTSCRPRLWVSSSSLLLSLLLDSFFACRLWITYYKQSTACQAAFFFFLSFFFLSFFFFS